MPSTKILLPAPQLQSSFTTTSTTLEAALTQPILQPVPVGQSQHQYSFLGKLFRSLFLFIPLLFCQSNSFMSVISQ